MDDFMFLKDYMNHNGGEASFSINGFLENAAFLRETDNSRLPNILWPVYGMFVPKWVLALILGIAMSITLYLGARITSCKLLNPWWYILFWGLCIGLLPWRGGMITGVFASNYFISSALILLFLALLAAINKGQKISIIKLLIIMFVGLSAGMSHEGFSLPVLVGLVFYAGLRKLGMPVSWWISVAVFGGGVLWLLTAPGMWLRLTQLDSLSSDNTLDLKLYGPNLTGFVLMVVAVCVCLCRKCWRVKLWSLFTQQNFTVCFAAAMAALALAVRSGWSIRALWAVELFSLVCFVAILRVSEIISIRSLRCLGVIGFCLILIFYANVIFWQKNINEQHNEIIALISSSESGTAYFDYNIYVPKTTLLHPVNTTWLEQWHLNQYNRFAPEGKIYNVVPVEISDLNVPIDSLPDVPGNSGLKIYKNTLLSRDQSLMTEQFVGQPFIPQACNHTLTYHLSNGLVYANMPTLYSRFISPCGENIIYVCPLHVDVIGPFRKVDFNR